MKVNAFDAEALKNAEVIEPFLQYFQELNEKHGNNGNLSKISVIDLGFSTLAQISGRELMLNSIYFNSLNLAKDGIKVFIARSWMPKKAGLRFAAAHEWAHLMTQELIDSNPRSDFWSFFRRRIAKAISGNSMKNADEFAADAVAAYLEQIDCSYAEKVVKYFQEKGVLKCFNL